MFRILLVALFLAAMPAFADEPPAHIVVMIDESPSMEPRMPQILDALHTLVWSIALAAGDPGSVTLSVIGYTSKARLIEIDGRTTFNPDEILAALAQIRIVRNGQEDGYQAIDLALDAIAKQRSAASHLLLITDEDRDVAAKDLDHTTVLERLHRERIVLDVLINLVMDCGDGERALGHAGGDQGFRVADSGGYARCASAGAAAGKGHGTTFLDYAALALTSGGSVWDVNALARLPVGRVVRPFQGKKVADPVAQKTVDPVAASQRMAEALSQAYATVVTARRRAALTDTGVTARPLAAPLRVWPLEAVKLRGGLSHARAAYDAIQEWSWDLDGDGMADQYGPEIAHAFADPGLQRVTLTVRGAGGYDTTPLWIMVRKSQ